MCSVLLCTTLRAFEFVAPAAAVDATSKPTHIPQRQPAPKQTASPRKMLCAKLWYFGRCRRTRVDGVEIIRVHTLARRQHGTNRTPPTARQDGEHGGGWTRAFLVPHRNLCIMYAPVLYVPSVYINT